MELEDYVIIEIKKVLDANRGLQGEIARISGEEKGTVSNWLTGKRKSEESFRRLAATVAGLDYNQLVDSYYIQYPQAHTTSSNVNHGTVNDMYTQQRGEINVHNNIPKTKLTPELETLVQMIGKKKNPFDLTIELIQIVAGRE